MAGQSHSDKLLPREGEEAQAFYDRIVEQLGARSTGSKDRAMLHASKAIATAWKKLDGMDNPFNAKAMDDPESPRENLETAIILMADTVKSNVSKLDQLKDPDDEIKEAIGKLGSGLPAAARKQVLSTVKGQVKSKYEQSVKGIVNDVRDTFEALIEMNEAIEEDAPEAEMAEEMAAAYDDFKAARKGLMGHNKGASKKKGKRRR